MSRVCGWLFLTGAGLCALTLLIAPLSTGAALAGQLVVAGVAALLAAGFLRWPGAVPGWCFPLTTLSAILMTTAVIYLSHDGASPYALYYVWLTVFAFYFYGRALAFGAIACVAVAYGSALAVLDPGPPALARWVLSLGTLLATGIVVRHLKARVDSLVVRLTDAAEHDPLTGLLNRRAFTERCEAELARARRTSGHISLLLGDLDRFKALNDRCGHEAGDRALERIGAILRVAARRTDTPARIGGEEFAIVAPAASRDSAWILAERLRWAVRRNFAEAEIKLTISFGVATFPDDGETVAELMRVADEALYAAKAGGRDRTVEQATRASTPRGVATAVALSGP